MPTTRTAPYQTAPIPAPAGIGLRFPHHDEIMASRPPVGFLEVHAENYMGGGRLVRDLETLRHDYPISLHCIGLSLGSDGPLDERHLERLSALAERIEPLFVSDHLSWSAVGGAYLNDLLPLPYTEEALAVFARHVEQVQERLRRPILIENPSSYLRFVHSALSEWDFLAEVVRRTGCGVILDVNNLYVSAKNHGFDVDPYLAAIPAAAVHEIHLAGHTLKHVDGRELRIDDHGSPVIAEVWALYEQANRLFGPTPTLIEWDSNIPPLTELIAEATKVDQIQAAAAPRTSDAAA